MRLICAAALMTACTVGEVPPYGASDGGTSTKPTPTPNPPPSTTGSGGSADCVPGVTANIGDGHHNPGQDCMNGCHDHGFTLAGTLYSGTTGLPGATITVTDASGTSLALVSQANGNFYTTQAVQFPVNVVASDCPNTKAMTESISAGAGTSTAGCNRSGCHEPAAGQGPIHLP